jgi:hypothetical protein
MSKDKNEKIEDKAEEKLPEEIEAEDLLILEKISLKEENLQLKAQMLQQAINQAQAEAAKVRAGMKVKYKLGDQDQVDTDSRKIIRKG